MKGKKMLRKNTFQSKNSLMAIVLLGTMVICGSAFAQDKASSDEELIEQYVNSKGNAVITFDSHNIKQFWVDKSVLSQKDCFRVQLKVNQTGFESIPLRIQLANVLESMSCKVEVITDAPHASFSVSNSNSKKLSDSVSEENFVQYHILSSVFHLEDTEDMSFNIKFFSPTDDNIPIKKVVLSFLNNEGGLFHSSPGKYTIEKKDLNPHSSIVTSKQTGSDSHMFSVSGKSFYAFFKKYFLLSDQPLSESVTIKNIGENDVRVYIGYAPFTKERVQFNNKITPYNNINKVLNVLSSEPDSNKIVVNSYPEWAKNCFVALNAKDDLSDFPNYDVLDGMVTEVNKTDDNKAEIILSKPVKEPIKTGTQIRIQGPPSTPFIYVGQKLLSPGEEETFESRLSKDDEFYQFSQKAFCKGTHYVQPVIVGVSVDPKEESTIQISNFTLSH